MRGADDVRRIYANEAIEVAAKGGRNSGDSGNPAPPTDPTTETFYTTLVNGDAVHQMGIDGTDIGIAVLETGLWKHSGIKYDTAGNARITAVYNVMTDTFANNPQSGDDPGGHGSHVASIAVSSLLSADGRYNGVAPGSPGLCPGVRRVRSGQLCRRHPCRGLGNNEQEQKQAQDQSSQPVVQRRGALPLLA